MGYDRQQKVRRPLGIVIDLMRDRLAATDVVGIPTLVIAPVPVGASMLVISRQMRCPALKRFAVDRIRSGSR